MKFKVGDRVKNIVTGEISIVKPNYSCGLNGSGMHKFKVKYANRGWDCMEEEKWDLVKRVKGGKTMKVNYLVTYEDQGDPFETFSDLKDLKKWLSEAGDNGYTDIRVFKVEKELKYKVSVDLV